MGKTWWRGTCLYSQPFGRLKQEDCKFECNLVPVLSCNNLSVIFGKIVLMAEQLSGNMTIGATKNWSLIERPERVRDIVMRDQRKLSLLICVFGSVLCMNSQIFIIDSAWIYYHPCFRDEQPRNDKKHSQGHTAIECSGSKVGSLSISAIHFHPCSCPPIPRTIFCEDSHLVITFLTLRIFRAYTSCFSKNSTIYFYATQSI